MVEDSCMVSGLFTFSRNTKKGIHLFPLIIVKYTVMDVHWGNKHPSTIVEDYSWVFTAGLLLQL
jgi:hypothetical protein